MSNIERTVYISWTWWVRPGYNTQACCTQAGPAHAAGRGGGMDRRQHLVMFYMRYRYCLHPIARAVVRNCWSPVTSAQARWVRQHSSEKRHRDRLPCGYVYRSSRWIGKSVSGLRPCCRHRGVSLTVHACSPIATVPEVHMCLYKFIYNGTYT